MPPRKIEQALEDSEQRYRFVNAAYEQAKQELGYA